MAALIYLVEITAYDPGLPGTTTLRYTSGLGFMTRPSETPANAHYKPMMGVRGQQSSGTPISFKRTMFATARVVGGGAVGTGEIVLNNADQSLANLRDYGIDGRDVVVRLGPQGGAYPADYTTILTGTAEQVVVGARTVTIRLRDKLQILKLPLQSTLYAGNNSLPNGAEGTADDIGGQRKPILLGRKYQIAPVRVNTAKEIWQFHSRASQAVDAVYDQGVALAASGTDRANLAAMEAAAPAAGQYDTCLALGLIRLGAAPAGRITMDARGDAVSSYVNTAARVVERILVDFCGISSGTLDSATFTALAAAAPAEIGVYITGDTTRQAAIDEALSGCGGWLSPDRTGQWQVGQLTAPGATDFDFTDVQILALDTLATKDDGAGIPAWRVHVRYKGYTAIGRADLAGAVTEARKAELVVPWREVYASDLSVLTTYLTSPSLVVHTPIQVAADAATEAARLLALHKVRRDYVQARVALSADNAAVDLGDVVTLTTDRLGYGAGRDFVVVGIDADGKRNRLTLDLWG